MAGRNIHLKEIDEKNWYDCCHLELFTHQKEFLETNAISILQSKYEPQLKPYAIYAEQEMVGFFMYSTVKEELDSYWIYRFMIDKKFQRKGLGAKAFQLILNQMSQLPDCSRIAVGYDEKNVGTHHFYAKMGFTDNGDRFGKEMAVVLEIPNSK